MCSGGSFLVCDPQEEVYNETSDSWLWNKKLDPCGKCGFVTVGFCFSCGLIIMQMCLSLQSGISIQEDTRCVWVHWWGAAPSHTLKICRRTLLVENNVLLLYVCGVFMLLCSSASDIFQFFSLHFPVCLLCEQCCRWFFFLLLFKKKFF